MHHEIYNLKVIRLMSCLQSLPCRPGHSQEKWARAEAPDVIVTEMVTEETHLGTLGKLEARCQPEVEIRLLLLLVSVRVSR